MSKLKRGLVKSYIEEKRQEQEQVALKQKHHIPESEERIIVEKRSAMKYFVLATGRVFHVSATVIILLLAVIGLSALIYPITRQELLNIIGVPNLL